MQRCHGLTKHGTKCKMSTKCRWHIIETCPICFDEVSLRCLHKTECGHVYHKNCIIKWFETSDECPMCRHEETSDPLIQFKRNIKANMESVYMEAIHSLERDNERLRQRRVRRGQ